MLYRNFCLLILTIFIITGCDKKVNEQTSAPETKEAKVSVQKLKLQNWAETISVYGLIEADEVNLNTNFSRKIEKIGFKEGQRVKRKAILVKFDSSKSKLRLKQAQTAVKAAAARLDEAKITAERKRRLHRNGNISQAELDSVEVALRSAIANYDDAIAAEQLAKEELSENILRSPVTGVIAKKLAEPGENVAPGQPIAIIQTVDTVRVATYVTEKEINHLRVGTFARMTTPGVRDKKYKARIDSLGVKADPQTGNFAVKLTLANDGLLRPGMTARVKLRGKVVKNALLIPDTALVDRNRHKVVYLAVEDKAVEVTPKLEVSSGNELLVLKGLKAGDHIITEGLSYIVNGSPITVEEQKP